MSLLDFEVGFEPELETWNIYELADGTTIRIKPLLVKLFRCGGPIPRAGEPSGEFSGRFQTVVAVKSSNPELRARHGVRRATPLEIQNLPRVDEESRSSTRTGTGTVWRRVTC